MIKQIYVHIGEQIRLARTDRNLTQSDLGRVVGLTRSSIANIEAGRQHTPAHVVLLIAAAVGKSITDLVPDQERLGHLSTVRVPPDQLRGQPEATHEFVTAALRRATGG